MAEAVQASRATAKELFTRAENALHQALEPQNQWLVKDSIISKFVLILRLMEEKN